ncbi:hypothetical protein H696_01576 [Fonticula alba]|uniref:Sugar phosphate transporter domain-containing protein n=1 Tax=Fonticula alba TaxID=691883 RepID=A0A058ZCR6_FONAL|nr:hypothetical protein H696_01576 [Fonticula alba]KCV72174.1 hypothetical protein H696_01576 [Fonticula alba]|eukprot:XP_009493752.1 hypothetical protein H696_01576 [Fonticula alba]
MVQNLRDPPANRGRGLAPNNSPGRADHGPLLGVAPPGSPSLSLETPAFLPAEGQPPGPGRGSPRPTGGTPTQPASASASWSRLDQLSGPAAGMAPGPGRKMPLGAASTEHEGHLAFIGPSAGPTSSQVPPQSPILQRLQAGSPGFSGLPLGLASGHAGDKPRTGGASYSPGTHHPMGSPGGGSPFAMRTLPSPLTGPGSPYHRGAGTVPASPQDSSFPGLLQPSPAGVGRPDAVSTIGLATGPASLLAPAHHSPLRTSFDISDPLGGLGAGRTGAPGGGADFPSPRTSIDIGAHRPSIDLSSVPLLHGPAAGLGGGGGGGGGGDHSAESPGGLGPSNGRPRAGSLAGAPTSSANGVLSGWLGNALQTTSRTVFRRTLRPEQKEVLLSYLWNGFYLVSWFSLSTMLSMYNKVLLGKSHLNFPYPLFMTSVHFFMHYAVSGVILRLAAWWHARGGQVNEALVNRKRISWADYRNKVAPTGIASALDIGLSNAALALVTLSFYTMIKSSAPVFLLGFAIAFRLEPLSLKLLGLISWMTIGIILTAYGETNFNATGFVLVLSAAILSGLRWTLTQVLLQKESLGLTHPLLTLNTTSPIMGAALLLIAFPLERLYLLPWSPYFSSLWKTTATAGLMGFGAVLAFLMLISEFAFVQASGAVSLTVAGLVKELLTVSVGCVVFGDQIGMINAAGMVIVMIGVCLYQMLKWRKAMAAARDREDLAQAAADGSELLVLPAAGPGPAASAGQLTGLAAEILRKEEIELLPLYHQQPRRAMPSAAIVPAAPAAITTTIATASNAVAPGVS